MKQGWNTRDNTSNTTVQGAACQPHAPGGRAGGGGGFEKFGQGGGDAHFWKGRSFFFFGPNEVVFWVKFEVILTRGLSDVAIGPLIKYPFFGYLERAGVERL